ncbi:MAG TPA: hypothetical protein PKK06_14540 [Phycisphaerae bacterium]|nr:hypothetical protein [Phycisphaerae bacterium]HNU46498.1 hypothetical protein [Phycisphaerae bacterium]
MSNQPKRPEQQTAESQSPARRPGDQSTKNVDRFVPLPPDGDKYSYKPPVGPVDQVKPVELPKPLKPAPPKRQPKKQQTCR